MFFRELPDPLVSHEVGLLHIPKILCIFCTLEVLFQKVIILYQVSKEILLYADQRSLTPIQLAGEIQGAVKGLSKPNKVTLKYLCDFLAEVSSPSIKIVNALKVVRIDQT